jgi:hypothetical protein
MENKVTKKFPKNNTTRANKLLELIHVDIVGPLPPSIGGSKYFITFIDDKSRFTYIFFLKSKVEFFEKFKNYKAMVENITQNKITTIRIDNVDEDGRKRKTFYTKVEEPLSLKEAIKGENNKEWKKAINLEYNALMDKMTWRLVKLPKGRKALGSKWVFKVKLKTDGTLDKYKARLVAKGYDQVEGIDFNKTYALVVKTTTTRLLLTLATILNLKVQQMDVKTAFLNGELDEIIYMTQPEGFVVEGKVRFKSYGVLKISASVRAGSQPLSMQQILPKTTQSIQKQNFEIPPKIKILVFFKNKKIYV